MAQRISDDEFIKIWNEHQSATIVSEVTGITLRSVFERRQSIERRLGVLLPAQLALQKGGKHNPEVVKMVMSARRDTNRLEIQNGTIIVGSDAHYSPGHIPTAHKALCNLIADLGSQVKAVVLNGDILDGGAISRHPRIRWQKRPTVKDELEAVQARLGEIEKIVKPGTRLMRTYGNHCARFESRLANQVPEYEGIGGFLLKDHLPLWADSDRIDVNEDMVIIHDWHSGLHSGWNDVLKGGCHTVTGHTHELSAKAHKGFKDLHYGIKTGMLADEFQEEFDYRIGKPGMNWQSGFAVLTWVDGMLLYPEFAAVREDGNCYFRGTRYA